MRLKFFLVAVLFVSFIPSFASSSEKTECEAVLSTSLRELLTEIDKTWDYTVRVYTKDVDGTLKHIVVLREDSIKRKKNAELGEKLWNEFSEIAVESDLNEGLYGANGLARLKQFKEIRSQSWITKAKIRHKLATKAPSADQIVHDMEGQWVPSKKAHIGSVMTQTKQYLAMAVAVASLTFGADQIYKTGDFIYQKNHGAESISLKEVSSPLDKMGVYDGLKEMPFYTLGTKLIKLKKDHGGEFLVAMFIGTELLRRARNYYPPLILASEKAAAMAASLDEFVKSKMTQDSMLVVTDQSSGIRIEELLTNKYNYKKVPAKDLLIEEELKHGASTWAKLKRKLRHWRIVLEDKSDRTFKDRSDF